MLQRSLKTQSQSQSHKITIPHSFVLQIIEFYFQVADVILFGMNVDEQTDTLGLTIISAVKAQGIPSVMGLIQVIFFLLLLLTQTLSLLFFFRMFP
jgi:hypothetical protein